MNIKTSGDYVKPIKEYLLQQGIKKKDISDKLIKRLLLNYEKLLYRSIRKGWAFETNNISIRPVETYKNMKLLLRLYAMQKIHKLAIKKKQGYVESSNTKR